MLFLYNYFNFISEILIIKIYMAVPLSNNYSHCQKKLDLIVSFFHQTPRVILTVFYQLTNT